MSSTCPPMSVLRVDDRAELRPGKFLLEAHCQPLLAEGSASDITTATVTSQSDISAMELALLINEPGEVINASFPRISALLANAQLSIVEKRVDDLYSQLQEVSKLLQAIIKAFIPVTEDLATQDPATFTVPEAESFRANARAENPIADEEPEPLRAMAMTA